MEDSIERYLYTEDEELLEKAELIAFGEESESGVISVKKEKVDWKWNMDEINAIISTISYIRGQDLCSYMAGSYLGIMIILNESEIENMEKDDWKTLSSPKISCSKISGLKAHEIIPILIYLNEHREFWKESIFGDASGYFSKD